MKRRNSKGFTLIELLIVVAIIGIIVAIAIPNLLNAIQRAKQKRSMADMRTAGTGSEAYAVDFNHYPAAAATITMPSGVTWPATLTFGAVASGFNGKVAPTYVRLLPIFDGWGSYYVYGTDNNNQHYVI
ncbi:MAG TPA: prepilin-type N-terminal cleavage/methylation domain-containing protein, partial [Thermoanaerobaculia bacterium]